MVRPLTTQDVKDGRTIYLEVTDRFIWQRWFVGPLLPDEANKEAEGYRKAGCFCDSIAAPTGYQQKLLA
jgi:hypothetical protein